MSESPAPVKRRVAFVVHRFGLEVNGGAELLCRQIAERLAEHWEVEVLTTCALDYTTWADHYAPGVEQRGNLVVRRFSVPRPRDTPRFNRMSESIRKRIGTLTLDEEEAWMREQGPCSPDLLAFIEKEKDDYDLFFFFTYLYATTYFGLPLVAEKAVLVPTAHDEWPIYFGMWDRLFDLPQGFVFLTLEEGEFLRRRFPGARLNGPTAGVAVEPAQATSPEAFCRTHRLASRTLLYVGRLDESKGVGQLLSDYQAYRRATGDVTTDLVLIGKAAMKIPDAPGVRALGFLPEQDKWDALAACSVLVMPSPFESLSIACLEAWSLGKPVLVNAHCEVLVGQCKRSQGGLWYGDPEVFSAALELLLAEQPLRDGLGRQGRCFGEKSYRWPAIMDAYRELAATILR